MNIFFLDFIPSICAIYHFDKHVIKMILETCQLLCSVHHVSNSEYKPPYKLTHKNHPSAVWTRESLSNYKWLCELGLELCKEYTYRYGKTHKCEEYIKKLSENLPPIEDIGFTTPKLAMPEQYKDDKDPIGSYKAYYFFEKQHMFKWTKRKTPEWVTELFNSFE